MSEQQSYYYSFKARASSGDFCIGDDCSGWLLSQVDTWHECPCNAAKGIAHPEADLDNLYVVSLDGVVVSYGHRKDKAQEWARKVATKRGSRDGLRIRLAPSTPALEGALHRDEVTRIR